jgi:predicted NBD/HSP70 family sugar kinase/mannose-6-phosphate isomerase class I
MPGTKPEFAIGIDIGGSHITAAIVNVDERRIIYDTLTKENLDPKQEATVILSVWTSCIRQCLDKFDGHPLIGMGISIPGPVDYEKGISELMGNDKYEKLYGLDLRHYLYIQFKDRISHPNKITFINDANGFLLGESWINDLRHDHIVAITLGTGIGSGFMQKGVVVNDGPGVPQRGEVFNMPFKNKWSEDFISTRWFLKEYRQRFGVGVKNVKEIADQAVESHKVRALFNEFGTNLGSFLEPILREFDADVLVFGGNVSKSYPLFREAFTSCFDQKIPRIHFSEDTEHAAVAGAVKNILSSGSKEVPRRLSDQFLMPIQELRETEPNSYDIYPSFELSDGSIETGYLKLAKALSSHSHVCIDGYLGIDWDVFIRRLTLAFEKLNVPCLCYNISSAYKNQKEIEEMVSPFLGGKDPLFGKLYPGKLLDFLDLNKLKDIEASENCLSILYGTGSALSHWNSKLIYIDLPKNELQYRSRAGRVFNLGTGLQLPPKEQYKRMFFVDWPVLNRHKQEILFKIDYMVDGQHQDDISWCDASTLRQGLGEITSNSFRVRPWFETGVWGGDWIKKHIKGLNTEVLNYAWSFEFIVPENGVVFSYKGMRLEISFDFLMYFSKEAVLGDSAPVFGTNFPIRFDFLDTFNGGNLSLQCHPNPEFIKKEFSEPFTQDETYYMLDAAPDARVYLGFHEDIEPQAFHEALLESQQKGTQMDVEKFVRVHPAKKHDLFLIPHGTVHCSGKNGLVLEISSTPYIYTFKMYDWMRKGLDGQPRPLNISRAMENLDFDCKGDRVEKDYISKQILIEQGESSKIFRLTTHPNHFYEIFRFEFKDRLEVKNKGQAHVLSLVEGQKIKITTGERSMVIHYAETFVVPAAAQKYELINLGESAVKVIQASVKPDYAL